MGSITSSVMPTYYGLAIILMLGGAVAAYVRSLQRSLGEFDCMLPSNTHRRNLCES